MCQQCTEYAHRLNTGEGTVSERFAMMNAIKRCPVAPSTYHPVKTSTLIAMAELDNELGLSPCLD